MPKRIGILCIHGIGDQQRAQYVDAVARQFREHLNIIYGANRVFVDVPGHKTNALTPDVSFGVRIDNDILIFDLVEVWWRDLGERPGFKRVIRFWWWALTLWTTTGFANTPTPGRSLPTRESISPIRRFSISLTERARLFFQSLSFFVLLLPAQLVISLLTVVPFIRRIDIFHSVYAYMSSVKLYQQKKNDTNQDVLDQVISRRVRIQKRVINLFLSMAESEFDQWFVLAHSLGSVIAFKALMYDGCAFARSLTYDRWSRVENDWKIKSPILSRNFLDKPPLPWWLSESDAIDLNAIYERFGGIVTYGSPVETFATLWPSIVEINDDLSHFHANWINLYDRRDFISSPVKSFNTVSDHLSIINVEVDSHWLIAKSHTNYLTAKRASSDVLRNLIGWFSGEFSITKLREGLTIKNRTGKVMLIIVLQMVVILFAGAAIFPIALYGIWNALVSTISFLDRLIQSQSLPPSFYDYLDSITRHISGMVIHFDRGEIILSGVWESLIIVATVLMMLGFLQLAVRQLKARVARTERSETGDSSIANHE
jgi:hypothetical protein